MAVRVLNLAGKPAPGIALAVTGGEPANTGRNGKARLPLPPGAKPNTWLALQTPGDAGLVILSPWDGQMWVPATGSAAEYSATVIVGKRGDRAMLDSAEALASAAARVCSALSPRPEASPEMKRNPAAALADTARWLGLEAGDLDRALHAKPVRATTPYQNGIALLYARQYAAAVPPLSESLLTWGKQLKKSPPDVVNAARFLGQALFELGKFDKAADAYRKAVALRPDDAISLNGLGLSLRRDGKSEIAQPILEHAAELAPLK